MATASSALRGLTPLFLFLLFTSTIGPLLFGYHLAELNAPQDVITCEKKSIDVARLQAIRAVVTNAAKSAPALGGSLPQCIPMTELQFGLVSSFFTLGGLVGALIAGPITSRYGRLKAMLYTGTSSIIGPLFEALAPNIVTMTVGRFIAGIGAGSATVVVPIYVSEISPPGKKGFFGSFTQVMINVGIVITQLQGLFLSKGSLWRIILGVGGAIALAQVIILLIAGQESPKWMADHGKPGRAKRILKRIRGHDVDIEEEVKEWRLEGDRDLTDEEETLLAGEDYLQGHPTDDQAESPEATPLTADTVPGIATKPASKSRDRQTVGILGVLYHPDHSAAVVAVVMIMIAQQFCGINSIVMYGVGLLSELLAANAAVLNVAVSAVNVAITALAAPLVERLGRKTCLLASMAGMGTSSVLLAFGIMRAVPVLSAVAVVGFVASFGLGLGPVPFILSSELVSSEAVGAVQSWALAANWIATFIVAQFFPIINKKLGKGQVYFIFAGFALFFFAFTVWWVPETRGKTDADEVWGRKKAQVRED